MACPFGELLPVVFVTRPRKPSALWTALESRYSPIVCIEGSSVRRRSEHFIPTGRGGFIVAHHSGVAQGRGVDRDSRDLCLDGLGKKNACDKNKQGKHASLQWNLLGRKTLLVKARP